MIDVKDLRKLVKDEYNSDEYKERRKRWEVYEKLYDGKLWADSENDKESKINMNYIFSTIETEGPLLTDNDPKWYMVAKMPFLQKLADRYQMAGDCLYQTSDFKTLSTELEQCAMLYEQGIEKVYFDGEEIVSEMLHPRNFVCSPGYTKLKDCTWAGSIQRKTLSWITKTFENGYKVNKDEDGDSAVEGKKKTDTLSLIKGEATIYEIWIRDDEVEIIEDIQEGTRKKVKKYPHGRLLVFSEHLDEYLRDEPYPYNHGRPPFVFYYDYKKPFSIWGTGEVKNLENLNKEFNVLLRKVAKHIELWGNPNWYNDSSNGLNTSLWKQLAAGGGQLFEINPGSKPPECGAPPMINPQALILLSLIPQLIEEATGKSAISKGQVSKKQRQSAQEISALLETSYTRTRGKIRKFEAAIKESFKMKLEIMMQYYTETRTMTRKVQNNFESIQIGNSAEFAKELYKPNPRMEGEPATDEEKQQEEDYKALLEYIGSDDEVYMDFDIIVDTDSTLPVTRQQKSQLLLQLANVRLDPSSPIDPQTLLEGMGFGNVDEIMTRLKAIQMNVAAQQQPQGVMQ
jgi:hypothetical protein